MPGNYMIKKLTLVFLVTLILSGCGGAANDFMTGYTESALGKRPTKAELDAELKSTIGWSDLQLVQQVGPPDKTYDVDGHRFLAYQTSYNVNRPSKDPSYTTVVNGNTAHTTSTGRVTGGTVTYSCTITFESVNSKIINANYSGNGCTY
ncbi:hypothetical protein MUW95_18850 [Klebsiella aerogenes]|uniref:hypothetical protein n=1 Tax=Klebsiella aerogenes TaxID=548 RepID=UPI0023B91635|nr:hypothetical protein [Klebsiella aerogenes]MCL9943875.1 hypothetical protein [Klebsiella aerogenes]WPR87056.1 hypothetical protein SM788_10240 [Klebsiella aerogenes]HBV4557676.1 hypothetical protein [Klebsiella aerogenes]HCM3125298.1 hypothetical protein [Klebsiella aerogenes]